MKRYRNTVISTGQGGVITDIIIVRGDVNLQL
jgi:hypothetical protein